MDLDLTDSEKVKNPRIFGGDLKFWVLNQEFEERNREEGRVMCGAIDMEASREGKKNKKEKTLFFCISKCTTFLFQHLPCSPLVM